MRPCFGGGVDLGGGLLAGEGERGGAADAAGRSGDERDLPVEAAAHGVTMTLIDSRSAIAR
jgi:hypothetical protein